MQIEQNENQNIKEEPSNFINDEIMNKLIEFYKHNLIIGFV